MDQVEQQEARAWHEYESAADWCARRGLRGDIGDPLPANLSIRASELINDDPEAFESRVKDYAYAHASRKSGGAA